MVNMPIRVRLLALSHCRPWRATVPDPCHMRAPRQLYKTAAFCTFLASAEAFNAAPLCSTPAVVRLPALRMDEAPAVATEEEATEDEGIPAPPPPPAVEYSEALPFLVRRASLGPKGVLVGDVGFDPLGFTEVLPLVRASLCLRLIAFAVAHIPRYQADCTTVAARTPTQPRLG